MLKHMPCTCKISQCDNKLFIQITQTWFEIDPTSYTLYCMQRFHIHQRRWSHVEQPLKEVLHVIASARCNYIDIMLFAQT